MATTAQQQFTWGTGRRKSAIARVRLTAGSGKFVVNGLDHDQYFQTPEERAPLMTPFKVTETEGKFDVLVNVKGGGKSAQADAVLLGLARALLTLNSEFDQPLREHSLLTRDPRMKERKKYGLRGARKGTQFSKR